MVIEPVTEAQARIAREAYRDFGRGSGHPARLNFGDCFAYALARQTGQPLLFKGDDFVHTDVTPATTGEDGSDGDGEPGPSGARRRGVARRNRPVGRAAHA